MEVKLESIDFKEIFEASILKAFDEKSRTELIKNAVAHLLSKTSNSWSSKTYLQEQFESALREVAREHFKNVIQTDPTIIAAFDGLIVEAVQKIAITNREKTVTALAEQIIKGLTPDKDY